jgi:phospholipid/cholesterol/gamma-HCH transport system permease protein
LRERVSGGKTDRALDAPAQTRIAPAAAFEPLDARRGMLRLTGDWTAAARSPSVSSLPASFPSGGEVRLDLQAVTKWDSSLLAWLFAFVTHCQTRKVTCDLTSLPAGIRQTLELALAVPERTDARPPGPPAGWVTRIGLSVSRGWVATRNIAEFIGETVLAAGRLVRGRAQFRRKDLILFMQEAGAEALPINLLISFLVGLILAFVGAVQLQQFGASVYVANLVAIAMTREMGCLMSGIIMCGRTGAAYAAQLGTMKVNQEIDAYRTFRFNPVEFLVLPRMLALFLMMPLLTVFANLAGIIGGLLIGVGMLDLTLL